MCVDKTQSFSEFLLFPEQHVIKKCQQDIAVVGEGFVETPGYPQFNVESNCTWKLRTQEGQRLQVSLLDVSLRGNYRNCAARGWQVALTSSTYSSCRTLITRLILVSGDCSKE